MEMEVVLGSEEEGRPKPCSSEIDTAEKTLEDVDNGQENGVRVSENGEQKLLGDSNVEDEKSKVETENLNESGVIEDCVMMNGVSSLLKLKQDKEIVEDEAEAVDGEAEAVYGEAEAEDGEDEDDDDDDDDEEHKYCVGDFVWGKIKNHPWWPGQIYDPSDASDLALKIKQKGKLLVAYFGDGTFAWCGASQLKPFAESFEECSKVSNSRSFLVAVEEAVEEIGRHIELVLVRDCAEEKHKFESREVNNAGIKEGVFVRDVRREMISGLLSGKHGEILEDVKCFAETVSFNGLLELEILKRKVSAFYRCKRGYGLTEYHEPQSVPGLEDKNNSDDEVEDVNNGFKWRAKRSSVEEEEEAALDPVESVQRSLEKCSGFPDHRLHHRRKQKSIAEILENESAAKVRFETEPVNGNVKSGKKKLKGLDEVKDEVKSVTTATPRRRKMSEVLTIEDAGHKQVGESSKGKTVSGKKKKRDVDDDDGSGDREETVKNESSDLEIDIDSTPLASLRKRLRVDASSVERTAGNGETATQTSKRERKKSKYLSPEYLSDFSRKVRKKSKVESESSKVSSQSQVGEQMIDASDSLVVVEEEMLEKPCEPSLDNGIGHQEPSEQLSNAVEFLRLGATPVELRDLIRVAALGTQYPKDSSSRDMVREFMTIYRSFTYHDGANNKFLGSYESSDKEKEELNETGKPESKGKDRKDKKLKAKQQAEEIEETDKHETTKKERKQKKSKSKKQGEEKEEAPKESSESKKKERKRKKPESKKQADEEEETQKVLSESTKKKKKTKKRKHEEEETWDETEKPEKKKMKKKREGKPKHEEEETEKKKKKKIREGKPKHEEEETQDETEKPGKKKKREEEKSKKQKVDEKKKETEKEFSGAELFVTFGPGSSLPKKEDLIEIYEKFGALDKERTDMLDTNFSGRVAFLAVADGEKAFESSQEKCPFASNLTVKFRLKYPNERTEVKKAEAEVAETTMEMEYVKKKLEEMRMLLDDCEEGMTEEVKVKLEGETVNLLGKVRKMRSS